MSAKTLAELNANAETTDYTWSGGYVLRTIIAVGACGSQMSYRGGTGTKVHVLSTQKIVKDLRPVDQRPRRTYQEGQNFSVRGACNGNGQNTGQVNPHLDLADVTCSKCRKAYGLDA